MEEHMSNIQHDNSSGESEFEERIVYINRVAKVVKGGRRFSFSALIVVGDGKGNVGFGLGKANEVPEAIRKGGEQAKKNMFFIPVLNETIPHEVMGRYGAAWVVMKPASKGTGVIAGGPVRAIVEAAGIKNILTKSIRSNNPHNVIKAAVNGLRNMISPEDAVRKRGKAREELVQWLRS